MKNLLLIGLLFILVLCDQLSKFWITKNFLLGESRTLIPDFFSLTFVRNDGAGFSILKGYRSFFLWITVFAIIVFAIMWIRSSKQNKWERIAYLLILAGTIGNFIDRLIAGSVVDFLDFVIFGYNFPVFNIADTLLTIGAILFILSIGKEKKNG